MKDIKYLKLHLFLYSSIAEVSISNDFLGRELRL
jgi:hypothetical protein